MKKSTFFLLRKFVCLIYQQTVCGFDLLRTHGKSFVCDVNGFSFVKTSKKYYDDCAQVNLIWYYHHNQHYYNFHYLYYYWVTCDRPVVKCVVVLSLFSDSNQTKWTNCTIVPSCLCGHIIASKLLSVISV